ncbi:MoaD/ThiS family protein [Aldersonia kunmingensis]|uniref:MoaD/ThiS family protein n=1 Tax=Aldersonia kunmingensis TaxID=408066 RepID=UPI00082E6D91|nr:MoaD/ThiS family protein [Aldersonia kunmingensis]
MADRIDIAVRYFAAAADAAGCVKETLALPESATLGDLADLLSERHGADMTRVLTVAAFLVDDELTRDRSQPVGPRVDVLPPFAGG